jgi:hypothetical protein
MDDPVVYLMKLITITGVELRGCYSNPWALEMVALAAEAGAAPTCSLAECRSNPVGQQRALWQAPWLYL